MGKHPGVPDGYPTGTDSVGMSGPPLNPRNNDRSGRVSSDEPRRTAFSRGAMVQAEAIGARLTISPSMKIPDPDGSAAATQGAGRVVSARRGRTNRDFSTAQYSTQ